MAKNETTSKKVASLAGQKLADKSATKPVKAIAASALTQAPDKPKAKPKKK